ncbi:MAG: alpha/beta fold hydrolase [Myxococcota bacterium]
MQDKRSVRWAFAKILSAISALTVACSGADARGDRAQGAAQTPQACGPQDGAASLSSGASLLEPLAPGDVVAEPVRFTSRGDELEGVVQTPGGSEGTRRPAVLLVGDAGPMDIDGHVGGSLGVALPVEVPVYARLASDLARRGFVVMRYTKRTCTRAQSARCPYPPSHVTKHRDEMITTLREDAGQALASLKNRSDVDVTQVVVVGHGQGAEIALGMAQRARAVVALAPPVHSPADVTKHQLARSAEYARMASEREGDTATGDLLRKQLAVIEREREELTRGMEGMSTAASTDVLLGVPVRVWRALGKLHEEAMQTTRHSSAPVLVLFAELDTTLPEDTPQAYKRALAPSSEGRGARVTRVLEDVTHDFVVLAEDREPAFSEEVSVAIVQFLDGVLRN